MASRRVGFNQSDPSAYRLEKDLLLPFYLSVFFKMRKVASLCVPYQSFVGNNLALKHETVGLCLPVQTFSAFVDSLLC